MFAYEEGQVVEKWAEPVFKKDEPVFCYRVTMDDGRWFEAADRHRLLLPSGVYGFLEELATSSLLPLLCGADQSTRDADGQHYAKKAVDSLDRCLTDCRQCGGRLLCDPEVDPIFPLSRVDVRPCSCSSSDSGGNPSKSTHSLACLLSDLLSSSCAWRQSVGLSFECECPEPCNDVGRSTLSTQDDSRLLCESVLRLRSFLSDQEDRFLSGPSVEVPLSIDGNKIAEICPIGIREVYDFEVPGPHNYVLAGLVHHNTFCASREAALHATGLYEDWWPGRRFDRPTEGWVASLTNEKTRDGAQRLLCGKEPNWGTGAIAGHLMARPSMMRGFPSLVDTVKVKHVTGGWSEVHFKAYMQGWQSFSTSTLDWAWPDEEMDDPRIYSELLARLSVRGGCLFLTATPTLGMTEIMNYFHPVPSSPDRHLTLMDLSDAGHFSEEQAAKITAAYPDHEREARTLGIPMLGEGRLFMVPESEIREISTELPEYWPVLAALDFGFDHPFAAVKLVHDPDADVIHVTHAYRQAKATPPIHWASCRSWIEGINVAWPHDGLQTEKGSGNPLADEYRKQGFRMIGEKACWQSGGFAYEPRILETRTRLETGRLKIAAHLTEVFEEYRMLHRVRTKDGLSKVVKLKDDLWSAIMVGIMMIRYARPTERNSAPTRVIDTAYDPIAVSAGR